MISLLAFLLGMCIVAITKCTLFIDQSALLTISIFSMAFTFEIFKNKRYSAYCISLLCGYFIRVLMLFYDVFTSNPFHLPEMGKVLTSDMKGFYNAAIEYSQGMIPHYGGLFSRLFGVFFYITAESRLWGQFIVVLFSVLTSFVFINTLEVLCIQKDDIRKCLWILNLLPNYLIQSVIFRRESIIVLLLSVSIHYFTKWLIFNPREINFIISAAMSLVASLFHGAVGLVIVGYLFVHLIYDPKEKRFHMNIKNMLFVLLISLIMIWVFTRFGNVFFLKLDKLQGIDDISSIRDAGGSSYARYVGNSNSILSLLLYAFPRLMYFMFSPFPWQWRGASDALAFSMSSLVYIIIYMKAICRLFHYNHRLMYRNELIVYLIIVLIITYIFSCGVTNTGTAMRHRDKFVVLYLLINILSSKKYILDLG